MPCAVEMSLWYLWVGLGCLNLVMNACHECMCRWKDCLVGLVWCDVTDFCRGDGVLTCRHVGHEDMLLSWMLVVWCFESFMVCRHL